MEKDQKWANLIKIRAKIASKNKKKIENDRVLNSSSNQNLISKPDFKSSSIRCLNLNGLESELSAIRIRIRIGKCISFVGTTDLKDA